MVYSGGNGLTGRTWIVVADSARANIFLREQKNSPLTPIASLAEPAMHQREQDFTTDISGRTFDSAGEGRHKINSDYSPKDHEREVFAKDIADRIESGRIAGDFEHLVLVAPPKFLGKLRDALSKTTLDKISREVQKNLVQLPENELVPYLSD
jgi:protein required for attachment to host cells